MSAATTGHVGHDRLHVTGHAQQRFLERVDSSERYPASAIQAVWEEVHHGEEAPHAAVLVYDRGPDNISIITVYSALQGDSEVVHA